jgi:hypothetical protein
MTLRPSPRFALRLLEWLVPDGAPLAGDILEEHARGRSRLWVWWQVLGAIVVVTGPAGDIRPIRLLDAQPVEAVTRTLAFRRRTRAVSLNANPSAHFGGLSVVVLGGVMTAAAPAMWALLVGAMMGGVGLGVALIRAERPPHQATSVRAV